MCESAVKDELETLEFVPDHFKTQITFSSQFVRDWFVTYQQLKIWNNVDDDDDDDDDYDDDDEIIEWYNGYQKRKARKAKIKEELMPIAWYPSRWWDWCISEEEKKETEELWK